MYSENPCFEDVDGWVIVWFGELSESEFAAYVHEHGNPDPDGPISVLSRDLGGWYDHHQLWGGCVAERKPLSEVAKAVGLMPASLVAEIGRRGSDVMATCVLVLFNAKLISSNERNLADGKLRALGCWREVSPVDY